MSSSSASTPAVGAAEWLTLDELAAYLKVSYRTAQRITSPAAGKERLVAARFGNVTRVRRWRSGWPHGNARHDAETMSARKS